MLTTQKPAAKRKKPFAEGAVELHLYHSTNVQLIEKTDSPFSLAATT
jgi:hypothetical protein